MPRILINLFHPNISNSRGNKILSESVRDLKEVTFRDVSSEYPNFEIKREPGA